MSCKDGPCSGGRGPITRLITQAWSLLSGAVAGHLSLLLSGQNEEESERVKAREDGTETEKVGQDVVDDCRLMPTDLKNKPR